MTPDVTTFDAIVVGSGISGGWAAKELCEKGLKTQLHGAQPQIRTLLAATKLEALFDFQ